jgi:ABC-type branched-subunit amino acid transport system substrate-binding protein
MSHICIIDLTSSFNNHLLSANLVIATIDDLTGAIINPPHVTANGSLNIKTLIALNQQVIEKFQRATDRSRYFGGIQIPDTMIVNNADRVDELRTDIQNLQRLLDLTFRHNSWSIIREQLLYSTIDIDPAESIRLVILTDDRDVQSLPIENTSFITNVLSKGNRSVSVVFAPQKQPRKLIWHDAPKILLILGSQQDIDAQAQIQINEIEKYFPAPAIFEKLHHPSKEEVLKIISDRVFDVIMMVGHSRANDNGIDGKIDINECDRISIQEFTQPFKNSVNNGLKLVILAGCSSIGVARVLASNQIGVPNVIAFRVPVHYRVLRLFFDRLLTRWITESQSLEVALTKTRGELSIFDGDCPGASILPILFTSPYDRPLKFPPKTRSLWQKILHTLVFYPLVTKKIRGKSVRIPPFALISLVAITAILTRFIPSSSKLEPACNSISGDGISCGEEIILQEANIRPQQYKQDGANAIANGEYAQAIVFLTRAWDAKKDPETLIMLENAKLASQNLPVKSIAITIPASQSTPLDIPTGMLKAVAFAQQQWNADTNHQWKLRVVIADDRNDKNYVRKLAEDLLRRGIVAGIGSYASEVTLVARDIYQKHNTVLISSTSTSSELTNTSADTFFFRICSSNQVSGKEIANYLKTHKYSKIALFHTPGRTFSDSMTSVLKANISPKNIVREFDFSGKGLATDDINLAKQAGAQAIVLIPDAYTSDAPERNRLLSIIRENNGNLPIIGNEVAKDQTLFNFSKQQLEKVVISLTWHPSTYQNNSIVPPGFWGNKAQLDHRIAMTYDATKVLVTALDRLPSIGSVALEENREINDSRKQIQEIIKNSIFSVNGITGQISFTGSDRSEAVNSLVRPKCDRTKCTGFEPTL